MRLMMKKRRGAQLVLIGEVFLLDGKPWVVTGSNDRDRTVYIARDRDLHTVLAEDIGMFWSNQ